MNSRWFQPPFCEAFPLAHLMREMFPQFWLRIHSLPESKRYAENDAERGIVFERYSRFGSALLGEGARCMVIQSGFNGSTRSAELMPELEWMPIRRIVNSEDEEDAWDSWAAHTVWEPKRFRSLLLSIADDQKRHVAFLSAVTDCVFVPYDGGADGFTFDTALLQRLSAEFAPWRSSLPSGL